MKIFKDRSLKKLKSLQVKVPFNGLKKSKRILVVFRNDSPNKSALAILIEAMLKPYNIRQDYIGYVFKKLDKNGGAFPGYYFKNQLTWRGFPKKEFVKDLTNHTYDVLIDLDEEKDTPNNFILLSAKAGLKVGVTNVKKEYDLVIEKANNNEKELTKELEHFLNNISKL